MVFPESRIWWGTRLPMAHTACSCIAPSPVSHAVRHRVASVAGQLPDAHAITRLCLVVRHHAPSNQDDSAVRMSYARPSALRSSSPRVSTFSCGVLVSSALLSCRLLRILRLAISLALLPQQAACCTSTSGNSAPASARRFPQPVWTTRGGVRCCLPGDSLRGVPRRQRGATSPLAARGDRRPWLAHKRSQRYACLRSRPRTGLCSR